MNIAFIGHYSENGMNGVSVTGYLLAKSLIGQGHSVFFYYLSDKDFTEKDGIGVTVRSFKKAGNFSLPKAMLDLLKNNPDKIEIFHIHSVFYPSNTLVTIALRKFKLPYVLSPHGGYNPNIFKRNRLKKLIYYHIFEKQMIRGASAIFCVADKEADDVKKLSYKGSTLITYNPIEAIEVPPQSNISDKQRKSIIFLGRYDIEHKGLDTLLYIFKEINTLDASIDLKLFGKGDEKQKLIDLAKHLELKNYSINDPIYGNQKFEELQRATISIMPSRWETFGTSSIEAAMMRVPVAVSRAYYMSNFVEENQLGIILDNDISKAALQLKAFIDNEALLSEIRSRNREIVTTVFSLPNIAKLVEEGYQKALASFRASTK